MSEKKEKPPINTKKWLYAFPLKKNAQIEVEETREENGEEIIVKKKKDVTETVEVYLKRPTRKMYDDCNLFYSVEISKGVKLGMMTRAMIAKRYKNDGGGLSREEQEDFGRKYNDLMLKEREFQIVQLNLQEDDTLSLEERQDKLKDLVKEIEEIKAEMEKYEVVAESLYEHTAEARAARRTNMWWLFFLTYVKFTNDKKGGIDDFAPFFEGKNFDQKSEFYERLEETITETENEFGADLIERASYILAAWNGGNAKTYEDFKRVDDSLEFIKEEVRKDETLQQVYDDKIKQLAGLEIESMQETYEEEAETEEVETEEVEVEEPQPQESETEEPQPQEPEDKPKEEPKVDEG
tara:strand:- start:995 stop:2050 length:1056 start_codon:yes stop_codon:yes gene_type:complete